MRLCKIILCLCGRELEQLWGDFEGICPFQHPLKLHNIRDRELLKRWGFNKLPIGCLAYRERGMQ